MRSARSSPDPGGALPGRPAPPRPTRCPRCPRGLGGTVPGISPFRTPNDDFYRVDTALLLPRVDADDWTLTIDGEVDRTVTLTFAELLAMPMIEKDITLMCVSNEVGGDLVGSARWLGVPVRDVLARAGLHPTRRPGAQHSVDGMTISTPVQALTDDRDALLVVGMNGAPLPIGARVPGATGHPGALRVRRRDEVAGPDDGDDVCRPHRLLDRPGMGDTGAVPHRVPDRHARGRGHGAAGRRYIGGVAWAQGRGISTVEVRVDSGSWQRATLGPDAGIDYWRQWYLPWQATSGSHTLMVRATDGTGALQTPAVTPPFPRGATGWDTVQVTVG